MSNQTRLHDEWQRFKSAIYKDGMFPEQEKQIHRAFFAGAFITFLLVENVPDGCTDEEALVRLTQLKAEIDQTMNDIKVSIQGRD